jgi:S1-C subfamily serine protease
LVLAVGVAAIVVGGWAFYVEYETGQELDRARAAITARTKRSDEITLKSFHPPQLANIATSGYVGQVSPAVIARVMASTVKIEGTYTHDARPSLLSYPGQRMTWFRRLLTEAPHKEGEENGEGAGVIVAPGVVLTAAHVVNKDRRGNVTYRVKYMDGRTFAVQSVSYSPTYDAAILHIADRSAPAVPFAPALPLAGESIATLGHPEALQWAVSTGTMSATRDMLARDGEGIAQELEMDLPLRPGNSGGPVIDAAGRLVGIATHGFKGTDYAMPASSAYESIQREQGRFLCYRVAKEPVANISRRVP